MAAERKKKEDDDDHLPTPHQADVLVAAAAGDSLGVLPRDHVHGRADVGGLVA